MGGEYGYIDIKPNGVKLGKTCLLCGSFIEIEHPNDPRIICNECINALRKIVAKEKNLI